MDHLAALGRCHHVFKVLDKAELQGVSLSYIKTEPGPRRVNMASIATHRKQKPRRRTITFMPNETDRTQGNSDSGTLRRSLRPRRAASNRPAPPTRTSDMSEARRGSQGNRHYMFIDQDASRITNNEAIRVHVMRESHRARRQLRGMMQNPETHGQMTIFSSAPSSPHPVRQAVPGRTERVERPDRIDGPSSGEQSPRRELEPQAAQLIDHRELKRLAQTRLTTVLTTTSAAISAASPGYRFLDGLPLNIIELCEDDVAALHALLALITSVQTTVSTLQAAEYESSALEILRSRLAESSTADHSDETIITVLLLSRLERSRMNEETAGFHEAALQRMIRDRGGLNALASSNEALVNLLRGYGLGQD